MASSIAATMIWGSICFSRLICSIIWSSRLAIPMLLPLHDQVRFANPIQRQFDNAPLDFNLHEAVTISRQASFEERGILDWLQRRNAGQATGKSFEIWGL